VSVPRYFFDVHDGDMIRDAKGVECSSLEEVKLLTKRLIPKLVGDLAFLGKDNLIYRVFVRDERGHMVYASALAYSGQWVNSNAPN
jgi:hypothetical protein